MILIILKVTLCGEFQSSCGDVEGDEGDEGDPRIMIPNQRIGTSASAIHRRDANADDC